MRDELSLQNFPSDPSISRNILLNQLRTPLRTTGIIPSFFFRSYTVYRKACRARIFFKIWKRKMRFPQYISLWGSECLSEFRRQEQRRRGRLLFLSDETSLSLFASLLSACMINRHTSDKYDSYYYLNSLPSSSNNC
jgi:hypothetical protein